MKDRLLLGAVAGLAGGAAKNIVCQILMSKNLAEFGGPERAAGMLLPAHKVSNSKGQIVGWLADNAIGGLLGIVTAYALSLTGKDKAALKGAIITGGVAWMGLYGVLGTMGATRVQSPHPKTVLSEFLVHTVYGAVTGATVAYLGHDDLFNGKIPIVAGTTKIQEQAEVNYHVSETSH